MLKTVVEKKSEMACAVEFQEAESSLSSKTPPLHANAPDPPKTVQNDKKSLGAGLNEVKKPNQRFHLSGCPR